MMLLPVYRESVRVFKVSSSLTICEITRRDRSEKIVLSKLIDGVCNLDGALQVIRTGETGSFVIGKVVYLRLNSCLGLLETFSEAMKFAAQRFTNVPIGVRFLVVLEQREKVISKLSIRWYLHLYFDVCQNSDRA